MEGHWRLLVLIDEYTRECLAIRVARRLGEPGGDRDAGGGDAVQRNPRIHPFRQWTRVRRSGAEEVVGKFGKLQARSTSSQEVLGRTGTAKVSMASCGTSKSEMERFSIHFGRRIDRDREVARVEYNTRRPHSSIGYRPPVPTAFAPQMAALRSPTAPWQSRHLRPCPMRL